jgi:hypothetical protein
MRNLLFLFILIFYDGVIGQESILEYKNLFYSSRSQALSSSNLSSNNNNLLDVIINSTINSKKEHEMGIFYSNYLIETSLIHINSSLSIENEKFVIGSYGLISNDIEKRDESSALIGIYNNQFLSFYVTWSTTFMENVLFGAQMSYDHISLDGYKYNKPYGGFSFMHIYSKKLNFLLNVKNILSVEDLVAEIGTSYQLDNLQMSFYSSYIEKNISIGIEKKINEYFNFLVSYSNKDRFTNSVFKQLSYGVQLLYTNFDLSIGYTPVALFSDQISLSLLCNL